ncbi:MAG: hypothetical protein OEW12_05760 [Deltaproteobacteria bacterium]|nr:hypothetical protein [Deltaproteobacteria bacterium]
MKTNKPVVTALAAWMVGMALVVSGCGGSPASPDGGTAANPNIVNTGTFTVEYIPPAMGAAMGKTTYKVLVTNSATKAPVTGAAVTVDPANTVMTMTGGMTHTTPIANTTLTDMGNGLYQGDIYYLMASTGGSWNLCINVDDHSGAVTMPEMADFTPNVGMAMGDTKAVQLKGFADKISNMMTPEARKYYLFNDGGTSGTAFNIFLATRESMLNHVAVSGGTILKDHMAATWKVDPATSLAVSSDGGTTWTSFTDNAGGKWSVNPGNLAPGTHNLRVKLSVTTNTPVTVWSGEFKTTDGLAATGTNDFQTFSVTVP